MKHINHINSNRLFIFVLIFSLALSFIYCGSARSSEGGGYAARTMPKAPASESDAAAGMADYGKSGFAARSDEDSSKITKERKSETDARMVIYGADYRLRVESVQKTVESIKEMTARFGGFIESLNTSDSYKYAKIVTRIPVVKFDEALDATDKLGIVEQKTVSASDVTMEFNDMALRVDTSKKIRERLYELLKRASKPSDKAEILREISRLTTEIDNISAQMNYLKSKADFSTLSIELKAIVHDTSKVYIASPFAWIALLSPYRRSIENTRDGDLSYEIPKGFFNYEKSFFEKYTSATDLFVNSDGTVKLRVGIVDNYPRADQKFWNDALKIDFENRKYAVKSTTRYEAKKGMAFDACTIHLAGKDVYMVAVGVKEDNIIVIEAYGRDEKSFESNKQVIESFIKSVEYE